MFPVAVKGSRPELQAQSEQGRLEVEEFPSRRECERKSEYASVCQREQHSLFPQGRSYGVICLSSKPHHLAGTRCMCVSPDVCEAIYLARSTRPTAHTQTRARRHIIQFPTSTSARSCWEQWKEGQAQRSNSKTST